MLNKLGLIAIEKGYADYNLNRNIDTYVYGYYQSERYFEKYKKDIKRLFDLTEQLYSHDYPGIRKIEERNTVCLSIKIEGNYYSPDYNICDASYYRKAIEYMINNIDNPLFFVCSDDLEKAKELFLKDYDIEMIYQPKEYAVSLSLCAMSKCKHFIINNTSFGWWAQYLSNNENKIVIAPSRWMNNSDPVSVYDGQKFMFV